MDALHIIGFVGLTLLLTGFTLNSLGKIDRDGYVYNVLNLLGGGILAWYSFAIKSLPFILLQSIWALVALIGICRQLSKRLTR